MFGVLGLVILFLLILLRNSFIIWDVEFIIFIFFIVLIFILILLIRYSVLTTVTLKIWFVYSLLKSLVSLNVSLILKLLSITPFIKFIATSYIPVFMTAYFLKLSLILSNRLHLLKVLRVKTFVFIASQKLFSFESYLNIYSPDDSDLLVSQNLNKLERSKKLNGLISSDRYGSFLKHSYGFVNFLDKLSKWLHLHLKGFLPCLWVWIDIIVLFFPTPSDPDPVDPDIGMVVNSVEPVKPVEPKRIKPDVDKREDFWISQSETFPKSSQAISTIRRSNNQKELCC